MSFCFAYGCDHRHGRDECSFYRFPPNIGDNWARLCRRGDRQLNRQNDRICSCHFVEGKKENGPSIFSWNKDKIFSYEDPVVKKKARYTTTAAAGRNSVENADKVWEGIEIEHNYSRVCDNASCIEKLQAKEDLICVLDAKVRSLQEELATAKAEAERLVPLKLRHIKEDDSKMRLYTSFPLDIFMILVALVKRFNLRYFYGWKVQNIPAEEQLLMTLMKLRLNLKYDDLAIRFCTSRHTVTNIVKTYICALHEFLYVNCMETIPSQKKCKGSMPKSFDEFGSARLVMDATEITQDIPHELNKQALTYSNYKSRHTVKAVVCVAPNAAIVYASKLYPGSVSDVAIVQDCGIISSLVAGDLILADKGFTLHRFLPAGVNLNIPPFLTNKSKFTKEEAKLCSKIARARIHVERANERIKNFEILNHIPCNLRPLSTKIIQLCCALVNLQDPLLAEISKNYNM